MAIFAFKYRSTGKLNLRNFLIFFDIATNLLSEALKQLHIIERTPEPELDPVQLFDGLTPAERLQMADLANQLKVSEPMISLPH